ncbi:sulfotransferase domain-containing protein [Phenylobacterium sp.]|uniref:sulfotransferase domain-containing protein n=1 Tax=Phenylobacterium sp. TaxID=1871053 RepID=UPI00374DAD27
MTDAHAASRARSLAEFGKLGGVMFAPADIGAGIGAYRARASDVVITPFAKCGTTWLQQIFHTLRTRGDFDFDDISRVVPWIETAKIVDLDLEAPQRAEPRGFKSHLSYTAVPKGARYIVAFRDPKDACVSMHKFMEGWFLEPGAVSMTEFAENWIGRGAAGTDYWTHLLSWWAERDNPAVLILSYEQMTAEPEAAIRQVAAFCGIALDDELMALTKAQSSFAFMLEHKDRFDDVMMRKASEARCNLPPGSDSAKVRKGGSGGHKAELSPDIAAAIDAMWAARVAPVTGFADYAALVAEIQRRNR